MTAKGYVGGVSILDVVGRAQGILDVVLRVRCISILGLVCGG